MIPKRIHYCWFGRQEKPADVKKYIESWKTHNPGYEIKEWNESNFDIDALPFTREAYRLKKYAFVADVARLYALIHEGGVYLDTDVEVLGSFDPFLENESFIGKESPYILSTAVIGTSTQCEWIKEFYKYYSNPDCHFISTRGLLNWTPNTQRLTRFIGDLYPDDIKLAVYDIDVLSAKLNTKGGKLLITDNTVAVHHFKSSWTGEGTFTCPLKVRLKHLIVRIVSDFNK